MPKKSSPTLDSVPTINTDGSRNFLRPADAKGTFTFYRRIVGVMLILFYVLMPWIKIGGHPALFFDIIHRRFHIFGLTFAAQDFWLTFFLITGLGFLLFFVTSVLGRVWCGWTCPHTVFLEHVYRRIERWIEGPVSEQKRLDRLPWSSSEKQLKRGVKQALFIFISLLITHVFISYFISIPVLYEWMTSNPAQHIHAFLFVIAMSGLLYFNFAWFREQLCLAICPYGRLQSALIDDDSIIIGYDEKRGEPRGRPNQEGVGDCIDCKRCISVCPTGIDIRQGLQLECVGCANCIDACDEVMLKYDRPKGLIRYDSLNSFAGKGRRIFRPRFFIYCFFMLVGLVVATFAFSNIQSAFMMVTRMTGAPFYETEALIRNQYNVRIVNKADELRSFKLEVLTDQPGFMQLGVNNVIDVEPLGEAVRPLVVTVQLEDFDGPFNFDVIVKSVDGEVELERNIPFLGPDYKALNREITFED
jgi:cytochrome c oxidase accessory protein FixG